MFIVRSLHFIRRDNFAALDYRLLPISFLACHAYRRLMLPSPPLL